MATKKQTPKPWKHQAATLRKGKRTPFFFDMSDPGTGKTRPAIERIAHFGGRTLIVAVKSNLEVVWRDEIHKWAPGMIPIVANANNRLAAFRNTHADAIITNIDAVTWIQAQGANFFKKLGISNLIIDESTHYKNHGTKRSKAALWVRQRPSIERVELMSGTPNPISVLDLWHQMMLVDLGDRLGNEFYRFRSTVCQPTKIYVPGGRTINRWDDLPHAEEAVFGLMQPVSIRHEFEECLDIPPNSQRYLDVTLPPKLRADYDQLLRTALIEHAKTPIVSKNAAVLHGKLLQLCSGAVYANSEEYRVFDTSRYELIADLIAERNHPSISFFAWRHQRDCISKALQTRGIKHAHLDGTVTNLSQRTKLINAFQAGDIQHLLIHPKTGAHGLTLTAGRTVIWCSPVPSPETFKQSVHRIYRGGQKHRTETICIRAARTVEEETYASKDRRQFKMSNFLDLIAMGEH
jgi:SNF2 family DNA or RNA helicase